MRALLLWAPLLMGCGLGLHVNTTTARTLPFQAHDDDVADYPGVDATPAPAVRYASEVRVAPFIAYYPRPAVVERNDSNEGGSHWSLSEPASRPEDELPKLLGAVDGAGADARPTLYGVVTDFQWYREGELAGGRIATHLTLVAADGGILFAAERSTEGRARSVEYLYRAHAEDWLKDRRLLAALAPKGGAR
jgi:hypothetical protein